MSTLIRSEAVSFYAARVRAALGALDPDVVEELTDGLEADLTESLLDGAQDQADPVAFVSELAVDDMDERFGAPADYAHELAQAAGLELAAPLAPGGRRRLRAVLGDTRAGVRADAAAFAERHAWVTASREFLVSLRPVWWIARGWGAYMIAFALVGERVAHHRHTPLPGNLLGWMALLGLVAVSIQVGRGRMLSPRGPWGRRLFRLVGLATGIAATVGLVQVTGTSSTDWQGRQAYAVNQALDARSAGAFIDGTSVGNLFVYGPDGEPVERARIVDENGRWLELAPDDYVGGSWREAGWDGFWTSGRVPSGIFGHVAYHEYPYTYLTEADLVPDDQTGLYLLRQGAEPVEPTWPQDRLQPLPGFEPGSAADGSEPGSESSEPAQPSDSPSSSEATQESPAVSAAPTEAAPTP